MNAKVVPLILLVVVLTGIVIAFRSLTILSTVLLIGAGAFAFLRQDEAAESRSRARGSTPAPRKPKITRSPSRSKPFCENPACSTNRCPRRSPRPRKSTVSIWPRSKRRPRRSPPRLRNLPELKALGAQVVAISPQLPDNSLTTQEKDELKYPVLSDVGNKIAHKFGVAFRLSDPLVKLYESVGHPLLEANGKDGESELPVPATFVIDTDGVIRRSHVDVDYTRRLDPDEVVEALKQIKK